MRPKLGIIGKWRFCYSERIFRVGRVARNIENACFSHFVAMYSVEKCISPVCKKPFGTYRNVWSWNGFDDIKQHANEGRNRFDQAVTASGATMQAGSLIHWRRPRRPARRGRIPLSENALAQTGAGTATVVLLTAIMALIDVGVYDICRVDSGLPKRFGRELSDAALIVACRNASVRRMIRRVVSMAWNHGCVYRAPRNRSLESFIWMEAS